MNTSLVILIVYMGLTIGISVYFAHKKQEDAKSFMVVKSSLGVMMVIPLLFAEIIAGAGTVGNAASAFSQGLSSVWLDWGMAIGVIMFVALVLKFYKAMNNEFGAISIPEAYKYIFDEKCRTVMLLVIVIVYTTLYSSQPVAAAAIIGPITGMNGTIATWFVSAIFILVTLNGGMRGIIWMNIVHALAMVGGLGFVAYKSIQYVGGMEVLYEALPTTHFSFIQPDVFTTIANAFGTSISMIASATIVVVAFSAKDMKTAKAGMAISATFIIPFALAPAFIGMCAKIILPNITPNSALFSMADQLGGIYSGIAGMAIIAAIWSTAPTLLLVASTTLTRDFYGLIKPNATDRQQLIFSKISIVLIGVIATFFGLNASSILNQLFGAFQIRSVVAIVLIVALFWPRVSTTAAFWSMLTGGILAAGWFIAGNPFGIACLWPALAVSLLILVTLTLCSKEKVSPGYKLYKDAVRMMLEKERLASEGNDS